MPSHELGELSSKVMGGPMSGRIQALRRLHELCNESENRMPLINDYAILSGCQRVIANDAGDGRLWACKLLLRISLEDGSEYPMVNESGLMDALKDAATRGDSAIKEQACNLISNLLYDKNTREPMVYDHSVLNTLVQMGDWQLKHSMTALQRLALTNSLRATMIREDGLMDLLNRTIESGEEANREMALDTVESLACDRDQCVPLVEHNALPVLTRAAERFHGKSQLLALKGLHRISEGNYCEMTMQEFPGLMDLLVKIFYDVPDAEQQKVILRCFWNLSSTNDVSNLMAHQPLLEMEMECLRSYDEDFNKYSSTFFFNLVYESPDWIKKRLKELNVTESLGALLEKGSETAFKATTCIAILIGADEKDSVITAKPDIINMFIDGLVSVLDTGSYLQGRWNKKNFLVPIQLLCVSDKNKPGFCKSRKFINTLVRIMKENISGDKKAVAQSVDIMLQITFFYEDNDSQGATRMLNLLDSGNVGELKNIIDKIQHSNDFDQSTRQSAGNLYRTLFSDQRVERPAAQAPAQPVKPPAAPSKPAPTKHIMISYSWKLNKELVCQLTTKMRQAGIEVWRDEEGSALLHPMSGSVDDTMASAVEMASDVVIFVSQAYKESANCQAEARYANKRAKQGKLRLHFVMVDPEYLDPEGWLGIMLGDQLWYKCWEPSHLDETCSALANLLGR